MDHNGHHITLIRSARKSIAIQINFEGRITVRAPLRASDRQIAEFIRAKSGWIEKTLAKLRVTDEEKIVPLTVDELHELAERALEYIPKRAEYYAKLIGVTYGRITIRNQRTRWGSCSSKGNLNFNCLLMLAPPEVIDSVVVHELCHRKEMNHSERFYAEVYKVFRDYDKCNKWLKANGQALMRRMPE